MKNVIFFLILLTNITSNLCMDDIYESFEPDFEQEDTVYSLNLDFWHMPNTEIFSATSGTEHDSFTQQTAALQYSTDCSAKKFKCNYKDCNLLFTKEALNDHKEQVHKGKRCTICNDVLSRNLTLKLHMAKFHLGGGFQCQYCDHSPYTRRNDLKMHILGTHTDAQISCPHCNTTFVFSNSLKAHLMTKHPNKNLIKQSLEELPCLPEK